MLSLTHYLLESTLGAPLWVDFSRREIHVTSPLYRGYCRLHIFRLHLHVQISPTSLTLKLRKLRPLQQLQSGCRAQKATAFGACESKESGKEENSEGRTPVATVAAQGREQERGEASFAYSKIAKQRG